MDKRQKKTLLTLLGIILLLLAALLTVFAVKSRNAKAEEEEKEAGTAGSITEQQAFSAISYWNGSTTLSFQTEESGAWVWADDPEFPLDDAVITSIADLVAALKPQQTITEGDTLESYGLEEPSATLDAVGTDGSTLSLAFGKATTDGTSCYMLMNGEESPVYIVAGTLLDKMGTAIYDMCALPTLPALTEDLLDTVTLVGAGDSVVLTAKHTRDGEETATTWHAGTEDVTGDETVAALLSELAGLRIVKCVDFKPTAEAVTICGFDQPAAAVTVAYATETGAEEKLTLYLGGETLDQTGCYLRLDADTTIYQVATDSVATLLRTATEGLGA